MEDMLGAKLLTVMFQKGGMAHEYESLIHMRN